MEPAGESGTVTISDQMSYFKIETLCRPRNVATAWDDGHLVCMAMMDHRASSTVLNQRWSTETGLHCLLQHFFAVF